MRLLLWEQRFREVFFVEMLRSCCSWMSLPFLLVLRLLVVSLPNLSLGTQPFPQIRVGHSSPRPTIIHKLGVRVLQGERDFSKDNKLLVEFELVGIPPAPRGLPQIEVIFDIDANRITTVSAQDKSTGKEQHITISSSGGLSEDEIEKMVKEAKLHAQDQERKALIEIKNSADSSIYSMEKSLADYRDKIPAEIASEIESAMVDLCNELAGDDAEKIKVKLYAANKAVSKIGQHMSGGSSGPSSGGSQGGNQSSEADYEEVKK